MIRHGGTKKKMKSNLEERLIDFAVRIILFLRRMLRQRDEIGKCLPNSAFVVHHLLFVNRYSIYN